MAEKSTFEKLVPWSFPIITIWGIVLFFDADDWRRWLGLVMLISGGITTIGLFRKGRQSPPP
jgi:hypothetical protein